MWTTRRLAIFASALGLGGLLLLLFATVSEPAKGEPLSGGILVIGLGKADLTKAIATVNADAPLLPVRFVGVYQTRAPKPHQRRYLTVLLARPEPFRQIFGDNLPSPCVFLGDGVPQSFRVSELVRWRPALRLFQNAPIRRLSPSQRALKWTVVLVAERLPDLGKSAWLVFTPHAERLTAVLSTHATKPIFISRRLALRPPSAFWTAWLGLVLLFACGHLALSLLWQRWQHFSPVNLLMRERWIYHFIAIVYFALYLTAIGVIYNRPDFQDALTMPLQPLGRWSLVGALVRLPLAWLWNWFVQIVTVMLPSAIVPPAGIVIGHWRGMVEQALTTAPIAHGGFLSGLTTALAVFWQGEVTIVAMVWSGLLTRAIIAPHTFGTDDYWQAYKNALRHFLPIAYLAGVLTLVATVGAFLAFMTSGF